LGLGWEHVLCHYRPHTSIGYGSFAPHTDSSKLLIRFVAIPAIALFDICILNTARLFIIIFVTELKRTPMMRPVFEKLRQSIRGAGSTGAKNQRSQISFRSPRVG
jgi:hypothetical protein